MSTQTVRCSCLGVALLVFSAQAQASCESDMQAFNAVAKDAKVQAITQALSDLNAGTQCGQEELAQARRATASRVFRVAYEGLSSGMPTERVDELLQQSEAIAPTWRTLALEGTRDHQSGRYVQAANRLQRALALIDDSHETTLVPAEETVRGLHQLASESLLLADEFVAPPQVRGVSSGVLAASVRGFAVQRTPLPIGFRTGSTEFTDQGLQAVEALWVALRGQGDSAVEIIGHADERGDEHYNMQLSMQRADTVRDWLQSKGLEREINTSGRGESQPLALLDSSAYSQSQRWRLNRRVELVRGETSH